MPGGFSTGGLANFNDQGTNTAASLGTVATASGSTNTKGAYAQLVASTPYDCCGFYLNLSGASNSNAGYLVDLAVGGAGSETVLIANLLYTVSNSQVHQTQQIFVPCGIPAGTRLAARCQSTTISATVTVSVVLADGVFSEGGPLGVATTYGALTGTSTGTNIDPGGTANTKGAWSQITASTTYDIGALQLISGDKNAMQTSDVLIDIGVGGAGSEQVVIPNITLAAHTAAIIIYGQAPPVFRVRIPSGTRLAIRAQNSTNSLGLRQFVSQLIGYAK